MKKQVIRLLTILWITAGWITVVPAASTTGKAQEACSLLRERAKKEVSFENPMVRLKLKAVNDLAALSAKSSSPQAGGKTVASTTAFPSPFEMALRFGDSYLLLTREITQTWRSVTARGETIWNEDEIRTFLKTAVSEYETPGPLWFRTHDGRRVELLCAKGGRTLDLDKTIQQIETAADRNHFFADPAWNVEEDLFDQGVFRPHVYVEVDLSRQHVYLFADGRLLFDTDCVSGTAGGERQSDPGIFQIYSKQSPAILRGPNGDGTFYESPVSYWMPYNGGEGLHDATWRGSFGGTIFQYDGSHGCINLPLNSAKYLYGHAATGTYVIVHR